MKAPDESLCTKKTAPQVSKRFWAAAFGRERSEEDLGSERER